MSRKITLVATPEVLHKFPSVGDAKNFVSKFLSEKDDSDVTRTGGLVLDWYSDEPISNGFALTCTFSSLKAFDLISDLAKALGDVRITL